MAFRIFVLVLSSHNKINSWKNNFMLTTRATFDISECQIKGILLVKKKISFTYKLLFASASVLLPSFWTLNQYNLLNEIFYKTSLIIFFFFFFFDCFWIDHEVSSCKTTGQLEFFKLQFKRKFTNFKVLRYVVPKKSFKPVRQSRIKINMAKNYVEDGSFELEEDTI